MPNWCSISCGGDCKAAPQSQLSSPGLIGRPGIPEALVIESKGRGVLGHPLSRGMTINYGATSCAQLRNQSCGSDGTSPDASMRSQPEGARRCCGRKRPL